jgi:hypothetical protein
MSNLKKLTFIKKLEELAKEKPRAISFCRIQKVFENSIYSKSGDAVLDFAIPLNEAHNLAEKYLIKKNYSKINRGYILN